MSLVICLRLVMVIEPLGRALTSADGAVHAQP